LLMKSVHLPKFFKMLKASNSFSQLNFRCQVSQLQNAVDMTLELQNIGLEYS